MRLVAGGVESCGGLVRCVVALVSRCCVAWRCSGVALWRRVAVLRYGIVVLFSIVLCCRFMADWDG